LDGGTDSAVQGRYLTPGAMRNAGRFSSPRDILSRTMDKTSTYTTSRRESHGFCLTFLKREVGIRFA
jgi:hypothetical protein